MIETDDLPILVNNFYNDDKNSLRRKELWHLDVTIELNK